jgi:hypothetical protein
MKNKKSLFIKITAVVAVITLMLLVFYQLFGYGSVSVINVEKDTTVFIDEIKQQNPTKIKLRPGEYELKILSTSVNETQTIKIKLFSKQTINTSSKKVDYNLAVSQALNREIEDLSVIEGKIVDNIWYGAIVYDSTVGTSDFVVLKYDNSRWESIYRGTGLDDNYKKTVPQAVQQYFSEIGSGKLYGD